MRIALLTPEYVAPNAPDGGLANYVKKIARALVLRRHSVAVLTLADRDDLTSEAGVDIHAIKRAPRLPAASRVFVVGSAERVSASLVEWRRFARRFWQAHRAEPFDVIHSASYMAPASFLVDNGRVPVCCRLSSYSPTVREAYGRRPSLADRVSDFYELALARRADACFAPSSLVQRVFEQRSGREVDLVRTPLEPAQVAPDLDWFAHHRPAGPYLLFFGTLSRIKGVDLLAAALPPILARHPELQLLLIGRDDGLPSGGSMLAHVRAACGDRVRYLTALDKARLQPFIANARAVLAPSRVDNYPNVCLEAQALGTPVIGTYGSSLDEMIEDGGTGFLAANGDPASLAAAIERLLGQSAAQATEMRRRILASVARAEQEDRVGQLVALYQRTIDRYAYGRRGLHG